jgi:hypothetical protein
MARDAFREEITISFYGPSLESHEMEVSVLASSLIAFRDLAEHVNNSVNKNSGVAVKVNGGFREGSFIVSLFVDCVAAVTPIISNILSVIEIYKFLQGKEPKTIKETISGLEVVNHLGNNATFNNCVINVSSQPIRRDMANLARPLNARVKLIELRPGDSALPKAEITEEDKAYFILPGDDAVEAETKQYSLEILAANFDGKASGWRFHDIEDDVDFSATVRDETFLQDVKNKKHKLQSGDVLGVTLTKLKRRVNQRLCVERYIDSVAERKRPEPIPE